MALPWKLLFEEAFLCIVDVQQSLLISSVKKMSPFEQELIFDQIFASKPLL